MTGERQVPRFAQDDGSFAQDDGSSAPDDGSGLSRDLEALGLTGHLESHARLAVLTIDARVAAQLSDPTLRTRAIAAARAHGFTNLALELESTPADAPAVHRD